jgi:CRP/FNR family transcriptional regulator
MRTVVPPAGFSRGGRRRFEVGGSMHAPHGLEVADSCTECQMRFSRLFCNLPIEALRTFDTIKYTTSFPRGAVLFFEGQLPRGIFVICKGRVKLSTCSSEGKALITQIAMPGEVIGLSAAVSGKPYEVSAETVEPCTVSFVKREDFTRFLSQHGDACLRVAQHLSNDYHTAFEKARSLGLSASAAEKLARLILDWTDREGKPTEQGAQVKLTLTHEEIAQMISASRETVTRLLGDFKSEGTIQIKGANLTVCDRRALESLVKS